MTRPTVVVDLDDAYPGNDRLPLLEEIRRQVPRFRVTLFAIPGRCTPSWVRQMQSRADWIDIVPHGWMHATNRECEKWGSVEAWEALDKAESRGFTTRGFKAPGWQISTECYLELLRRGYWVADQSYNVTRRPAALPAYVLNEPPAGVVQIHGHVGHLNGRNENELEYLVEEILRYRDAEFGFVRDYVAAPTP